MTQPSDPDAEARNALRLIGPDPANWVVDRPGIDHNVVLVGGGQTGCALAFALRRAGIRLRGTVESVDDELGVIVVRVKTHVRMIYVNDKTDLQDIPSPSENHIGLHAGDRISVHGVLQPDGSVQADIVSLSQNIHAPAPPTVNNNTGR